MIHIVIDTNILRSHFVSNTIDFFALTSLGHQKLIQLHIPYIVKQEYLTFLYKQEADKFKKSKSALSDLKRSNFVSKSNVVFLNRVMSRMALV